MYFDAGQLSPNPCGIRPSYITHRAAYTGLSVSSGSATMDPTEFFSNTLPIILHLAAVSPGWNIPPGPPSPPLQHLERIRRLRLPQGQTWSDFPDFRRTGWRHLAMGATCAAALSKHPQTPYPSNLDNTHPGFGSSQLPGEAPAWG